MIALIFWKECSDLRNHFLSVKICD